MNIKNDDYVVVFKLTDDLNLKSYFTDCTILLNNNDLVAVYEETCTLALGSSMFKISWDKYMNLVNGCNFEEMLYSEYLIKHRENVLRYNPDAPVIVTINENNNVKTINIAGSNILLQRH